MQKNANRPTPITLHTTQDKMEQSPQHKTGYTEADKKNNGGRTLNSSAQEKASSKAYQQALRSKTDKLNHMKLKFFCKAKGTLIWTKGQTTE